MDESICYYCNEKANSLEIVVEHCINWHINNEIKYRQLVLDRTSGTFRYLTNTHPDLIPLILIKNGKICVSIWSLVVTTK